LFSHGWNGFNAQNTGQMIQLASRGFVVVAVNHTYGAIATIFPDGRIAYNNPKALPDGAPDAEYEIAARKLVNQWAGDLSFTLDNLVTGEHLPANSLDFNRIGVYGHSTGGGAAIQFCGTDPRCKALLGMDPFMRPVSAQVLAKGVSQPSFFMFSQGWDDLTDSKNNQLFNEFYPKVSDKKGAIAIQGTKHYDFSDLPLLSPIAPQLGLKGPLNGKRVTEIVDAYLIEFFEMTLNGKPSNLFNGNFSDFPEVKIKAVPLVFPL
jgi:dienelactone hydrolase